MSAFIKNKNTTLFQNPTQYAGFRPARQAFQALNQAPGESLKAEVLKPATDKIGIPFANQEISKIVTDAGKIAYPENLAARESYEKELSGIFLKLSHTFSAILDQSKLSQEQIDKEDLSHLQRLLAKANCTRVEIIHETQKREISLNFINAKNEQISLYVERHNEIQDENTEARANLRALLPHLPENPNRAA